MDITNATNDPGGAMLREGLGSRRGIGGWVGWMIVIAWLLVGGVAAGKPALAGFTPTPTETPTLTPTVTLTPTPTETPTLTPTVTLTPTPTETPTLTPTVTLTPTPTETPLPPPLPSPTETPTPTPVPLLPETGGDASVPWVLIALGAGALLTGWLAKRRISGIGHGS
jgi:LPXTG-motif cell wall-anchored protein